MDGDSDAQLGVIDVLFGLLDEENADEFLTRLEGLLSSGAFPRDRAVRWAILREAASLQHAEAAMKLSCASPPEAFRFVLDDPVMRHEAVVSVLTRAAGLRPDAHLQSLIEVLDRCDEIAVVDAFEELTYVIEAYECLINRHDDIAEQHRHLRLLQVEGERRMSPWLLATALKVGAALLLSDPTSVVISNATTLYMLAAVHALHGRIDAATRYIQAALAILDMVPAIDSPELIRTREKAAEIAGFIGTLPPAAR